MFVRLIGKEKEAFEKNYSHPFTDVPDWANPYVGYMYQKGHTKGTGNNLFGSNDLLTASQFITFILRALGYDDSNGDFLWNEAVAKAEEIQILDPAEARRLQTTDVFLRDDVVGISYNALKAQIKNSETKLIDFLIENKVVSKEKAAKHNLNKEEYIVQVPNTTSNFPADGNLFFSAQDDYIFFFNVGDGYKLYRMKTDDDKVEKLSDSITGAFISVIGDQIFYTQYESLYRIGLDLTGKRKLADNSSRLYIKDGWAYFTDDKPALFKVRLDGSGLTQLTSGGTQSYIIAGNKIYFDGPGERGNALFELNLETGEEKVLEEEYRPFPGLFPCEDQTVCG